MKKVIITILTFLSVCQLASANVLCASQIQKKAEELAESKIGGTCIASAPEPTSPAPNLHVASGSVSGICKKNISAASILREPFSYSFSVSAFAYNQTGSCDTAYTISE